ncbi:helix-turn-helix domain-containing protein [Streptomyces sp. MST-110588]|uniref:helix-turn-helix domain-containing protein n=1 Tax=Streptomyces sp. MST-110588 TaxID=2833628 RepID=UPI001F5DCC60|nr:helix-turn-helix domain-containing protein [Streptomyces sp. MST-110588]UNO43566.1 helix-turn-helix transcriptional regulator [Streptomyces sp. MST-110588]
MCPRCDKEIRYTGRGRPRLYCSRSCQRRKGPPAQSLETGPQRCDVLQAAHHTTGALLDAEYQSSPGLAQRLAGSAQARKLLDLYDSLTVLQLRAEGASWKAVGKTVGISASTARRKWVRATVAGKLRQFDALQSAGPPSPDPVPPAVLPIPRQRPAHNTGAPPGPPATDEEPAGLTSTQQFANALSHLHRTSGKAMRELAQDAHVSASYVSRVISGERLPSWPVARRLTIACGGDPCAVATLWRAARSVPVTTDISPHDAADALHAALRGLYLSARQPDTYLLSVLSHHALTEEEITAVFEGRHCPDWPALGRLVLALDGRPAALRPLWNAAYRTASHASPPAPASPAPHPPPTTALTHTGTHAPLPVSAFG